MKKLVLFGLVCVLAACQAPYERNVYQYTAPRMCFEYANSFRCGAPTQVWHETVYPKNEAQMQYGNPQYIDYQPQSLSRSVYGTY